MPEDVLVTICELHVASSVAEVHNITVAVSTDENQEKCSFFSLFDTSH